jgi:serine phosphatase RsbU (regulator of sigma subunit)
MARRFLLAAAPMAPARGLAERMRAFLLDSWAGRILLVALAVWLLGRAGLPLPGSITVTARLVLVVYAVWGVLRLLRSGLRRLLWRIRTKLILSYLFIAFVPVALLSLFFFIAGVIVVSLVASHLVTVEVERLAQSLETVAQAAHAGLPADDAAAATTLPSRVASAAAVHPDVSWTLVRRGRVAAAKGRAPRVLPAWLKGPLFAGIVKQGEGEPDALRAVSVTGDSFLILETPVDARVFADLERRTTIHLLSAGGTVRKTVDQRGITIDIDDQRQVRIAEAEPGTGFNFVAVVDRTDWATGGKDLTGLSFQFRPRELLRNLSPGAVNMGDVLVIALTVVGSIFLVMYAVAFLLGLLLARSITRSVHALSMGTERLRRGDFGHSIQVKSRDQLGELAESFNLMSRGIRDLLREQAEKERLEEELRIARQIQMSLLPAQGVSLPGLRIAALCLPAAEVGGDYYDLLPLSDTRMGVLVADVSGKGTSAALYMAELKGLVLSLSRIYDSPARLLVEANRILSASMDTRTFITMTYAIVDTAAATMRYARAGHNPIIHLEAGSGRTQVLAPPGLGLGLERGERFGEILEEAVVPLRRDDLFLFFTDGLSEAMNSRAELFGESRLLRIMEGSDGLGEGEIKERILEEIRGFVGGAAQHDDMTLVILKVA